jgi:hypothetical protein
MAIGTTETAGKNKIGIMAIVWNSEDRLCRPISSDYVKISGALFASAGFVC